MWFHLVQEEVVDKHLVEKVQSIVDHQVVAELRIVELSILVEEDVLPPKYDSTWWELCWPLLLQRLWWISIAHFWPKSDYKISTDFTPRSHTVFRSFPVALCSFHFYTAWWWWARQKRCPFLASAHTPTSCLHLVCSSILGDRHSGLRFGTTR